VLEGEFGGWKGVAGSNTAQLREDGEDKGDKGDKEDGEKKT